MEDITYKTCESFYDIIKEIVPVGYIGAKVLRVYDGDTAWFAVYHEGDHMRIKGRFDSISAEEIRGGTEESRAIGIETRDIVRELIDQKNVLLEIHGMGKYFRHIVTVYVPLDQWPDASDYNLCGLNHYGVKYINLNLWLLLNGLAEEY